MHTAAKNDGIGKLMVKEKARAKKLLPVLKRLKNRLKSSENEMENMARIIKCPGGRVKFHHQNCVFLDVL